MAWKVLALKNSVPASWTSPAHQSMRCGSQVISYPLPAAVAMTNGRVPPPAEAGPG
jgi:hypothetical protein